jgi:hypothetical protein
MNHVLAHYLKRAHAFYAGVRSVTKLKLILEVRHRGSSRLTERILPFFRNHEFGNESHPVRDLSAGASKESPYVATRCIAAPDSQSSLTKRFVCKGSKEEDCVEEIRFPNAVWSSDARKRPQANVEAI